VRRVGVVVEREVEEGAEVEGDVRRVVRNRVEVDVDPSAGAAR
jgi:hypothetical protein